MPGREQELKPSHKARKRLIRKCSVHLQRMTLSTHIYWGRLSERRSPCNLIVTMWPPSHRSKICIKLLEGSKIPNINKTMRGHLWWEILLGPQGQSPEMPMRTQLITVPQNFHDWSGEFSVPVTVSQPQLENIHRDGKQYHVSSKTGARYRSSCL
jgi:hypothetical protein